MEIIKVSNNHLANNNPETEYGCVCDRYGSIFIFKRSEASRPRCINANPKHCYTICPNSNCQRLISLDKCKEFKNEDDKILFKQQYNPFKDLKPKEIPTVRRTYEYHEKR